MIPPAPTSPPPAEAPRAPRVPDLAAETHALAEQVARHGWRQTPTSSAREGTVRL